MRILFLIDLWDPRIGSSIRQMYQHAEGLRALGHETAVVSTTTKTEEVGWRTVEGTELFLVHSDYPFRFRPWVSLNHTSAIRALRPVLEEWRPDVVHSHLIHTHLSYEALREARRVGAGVVFTAHDSMTFCYQKLDCFHGGKEHQWEQRDYKAHWSKCIPCQRFRYRPGRNKAIREVLAETVDRFTVVTDEQAVAIRANDIRVDRTVNNAIRLQATIPTDEKVRAFRERFDLEGKPTVAIGGRLHDLKGVGQVFEMLRLLREEFPDIRMLALGKEEVYAGFQPHAKELGVDDLVVSTGWLDGEDLHCAMAATDVMLTPSICFETFGMMNLEAMEFRRPVVATSFGGCPEVVRDGVNGFVANPYDVEAFAARIAELLRDPELRSEMGEAGYELLAEHFTIDRLTREFMEEYELAASSARDRLVQT
jgi:glycosyltransferase involved in cell wall biosynthesis